METRKLPAVSPRVETGPVQFGNGWTGVFIRGDDALHFALQLERAIQDPTDPIAEMSILGLIRTLRSADKRPQP